MSYHHPNIFTCSLSKVASPLSYYASRAPPLVMPQPPSQPPPSSSSAPASASDPAFRSKRARLLEVVFDRAVSKTVEKVNYDNFGQCFPAAATGAPETLRAVHEQMIENWRTQSRVFDPLPTKMDASGNRGLPSHDGERGGEREHDSADGSRVVSRNLTRYYKNGTPYRN